MRRERITITIRHDVVGKIDTIIDGQTIRNRSNAIETIVLDHFKNNILQKAVLLGGSYGIKIHNKMIAKLLMPIDGKTLLEKNIETLKRFGVNEVIVAAAEWTDDIKKLCGNGEKLGVSLTYFDKTKYGTGGVLKYVQKTSKETFFMANGDILLEGIDLEDMYNFHKKNNGLGTIGVAMMPDSSKLGSIFMKGSHIVDFKEKPTESKHQSHLINGGVYMLEPEVCKLVTANFSMVEHDIFPQLAWQKKLFGYQLDQDWVHLHDEDAYEKYLKKK